MAHDSVRPPSQSRVLATADLTRSTGGDPRARERLFTMVHDELRAMASRLMRGERSAHTLQPTALVHEAWIRLIRAEEARPEDRAHFLGLAARAMRQILVEHARARARDKRGGIARRVEFPEDAAAPAEPEEIDLVALDQALERLKERSEPLARLVELRFFAGLSCSELAEALGVSTATVGRDWRAARALLSSYMLEG